MVRVLFGSVFNLSQAPDSGGNESEAKAASRAKFIINMAMSKKQELAESVRGVFQVLKQHPEGLSTKELWEHLNELLNKEAGANPSFEEISFACVQGIGSTVAPAAVSAAASGS